MGLTDLHPRFTVLVFGANLSGFHGAGTAGTLWKSSMTSWRTDLHFQRGYDAWKRQIKTGRIDVEDAMMGEFNTLGEIGLQKGRLGFSYGIVTTERAGFQGCVTDDVMFYELRKLRQEALKHSSTITRISCA